MRRVGNSTWLKIVSWGPGTESLGQGSQMPERAMRTTTRAGRRLVHGGKGLFVTCVDLESTKRSGEGPRSAYLLHVSMLLSHQLRSDDYDPAPHSVMSSIVFTLVLSIRLVRIIDLISFPEYFTWHLVPLPLVLMVTYTHMHKTTADQQSSCLGTPITQLARATRGVAGLQPNLRLYSGPQTTPIGTRCPCLSRDFTGLWMSRSTVHFRCHCHSLLKRAAWVAATAHLLHPTHLGII